MNKIKRFIQNAIYGKHATPLPAKYVAIAFMAEVIIYNMLYMIFQCIYTGTQNSTEYTLFHNLQGHKGDFELTKIDEAKI